MNQVFIEQLPSGEQNHTGSGIDQNQKSGR